MQLTHIYNRATGAFAHVPGKSVATWANHGWEIVQPEPVQDEDSAAEAESASKARHPSRGKPSADTQKDK